MATTIVVLQPCTERNALNRVGYRVLTWNPLSLSVVRKRLVTHTSTADRVGCNQRGSRQLLLGYSDLIRNKTCLALVRHSHAHSEFLHLIKRGSLMAEVKLLVNTRVQHKPTEDMRSWTYDQSHICLYGCLYLAPATFSCA